MRKTICLDFNGVFDDYKGRVKGSDGTNYAPKPGVKEFLQVLHQDFDIAVCTVIDPIAVRNWLDRYDLSQYIGTVTNTKPIASMYVDDRAIQFNGDYNYVLEQIKTFKPYWEK